MRILLKGPFTPYSGYGSDLIALSQTLMRWGCELFIQPSHMEGPIPADVLMLLTKHIEAPFDLILVHVDPEHVYASPGMKSSADLTVGWTMWEYASMTPLFKKWADIPVEYQPKDAVTSANFGQRLDTFDVIAAYDENSNQALAQHASIPIVTVQGGYSAAEWPFLKRDWDDPTFRFCMQGALHARKSPMLAIEAFKELREEHEDFTAELHLKSVPGTGLHPKMEEWCPGLKIHYGVWKHKELLDFYGQMHVMLCPSRGEGKNLPALQFLTTGAPVIATNWGGHTGWLSDAYAYPLNYELELDPERGAHSASPDKAHLKELMLHTFRNRLDARERGAAGARTIPIMCSWEAAFERLLTRLEDVHPKGAQVKEAAIRCRQEQDVEHLFERNKKLGVRI